ncbi:hypothetical protein P171DRAFT_431168 [Karstenula rhodostoma CBS 690.94]|uniref:Extracellular membrane protein CFEM domain-containing protein n=1 Tax=Karstenula rhodostoma CBS 690.94 TaxID=1392251 RepID=A0A9P4UCZ7_9PLEO|nr:hypothetical protein P171DRAFT_431168 [Karstenula rhodostoma CBS 690.94]
MSFTSVLLLAVAGTMVHGELVTLQVRGARPPPSWCSESSHSCPSTMVPQTSTEEASVVTLLPPVSITEAPEPSTTSSFFDASAWPTGNTAKPVPPPCAGRCLPGGVFYDCQLDDASNDFSCVCSKQRRFVDEFFDSVAPCVANSTGCSEGEWAAYMYMMESTCGALGNPISTLPSTISTWMKYTYSPTASDTGGAVETPSTMVTSTSSGSSGPAGSSNSSGSADGAGGGSSGMSTGAVAGLGAGISIGALAVIAGVAFFIWRKRRRQAQPKTTEEVDDATPPPDAPVDEKKAQVFEHSVGASELDGADERAELYSPPTVAEVGTGAYVSELPGDSNYLQTSPKPDAARMSNVSELEADVGKKEK